MEPITTLPTTLPQQTVRNPQHLEDFDSGVADIAVACIEALGECSEEIGECISEKCCGGNKDPKEKKKEWCCG